MARFSPFSVIRKARPIISTSFSDFASRSGQKNPFVARTRIWFAASLLSHNRVQSLQGQLPILRHVFLGNVLELFRRVGPFSTSLHFSLELAEHDEFIRIGLLATSIDFQIAQDERALAISFQEDEWIRRPKLCRIKLVRIGFAGGDDQAGRFVFVFADSLGLRRFSLQGNRIGCQTVR